MLSEVPCAVPLAWDNGLGTAPIQRLLRVPRDPSTRVTGLHSLRMTD